MKKSQAKIYSQHIKDTKHKPSNSLAINNNIVKAQNIIQNNKKIS